MSLQTPEFDDYAPEYDGGADNLLKRLLGDESAYIEWKVVWLHNRIQRTANAQSPLSVLDFGCGTGLALSLWRRRRPQDLLAGTDVSEQMLLQAVRRWPDKLLPEFKVFHTGRQTWPQDSFDLIIISGVLHHIPPDDRDSIVQEVFHLLKPGGQICIFEHNPQNFLVRYVVRNTKIDQNAILLRAEESASRLRRAGCDDVKSSFLMLFPPVLKMLAGLDARLGWLPLGGQYAVTGFRPQAKTR